MKCIKCFSTMYGPDIILDVDKNYLSINPNKYMEIVRTTQNIEIYKLSYIRNKPNFNMNAKLSMCCIECGNTVTDGANTKLNSSQNIEMKFKKFANKIKF